MKKYILQRKNSFLVAWSGLFTFIRREDHAAIHLTAAICVLILAWICSVNRMELIALIMAIGLVILTEILNTALEKLTDFVQPDIDPRIKTIKDIAAGAVLWSAIVSAVIGGIVFLPYIMSYIK